MFQTLIAISSASQWTYSMSVPETAKALVHKARCRAHVKHVRVMPLLAFWLAVESDTLQGCQASGVVSKSSATSAAACGSKSHKRG